MKSKNIIKGWSPMSVYTSLKLIKLPILAVIFLTYTAMTFSARSDDFCDALKRIEASSNINFDDLLASALRHETIKTIPRGLRGTVYSFSNLIPNTTLNQLSMFPAQSDSAAYNDYLAILNPPLSLPLRGTQLQNIATINAIHRRVIAEWVKSIKECFVGAIQQSRRQRSGRSVLEYYELFSLPNGHQIYVYSREVSDIQGTDMTSSFIILRSGLPFSPNEIQLRGY